MSAKAFGLPPPRPQQKYFFNYNTFKFLKQEIKENSKHKKKLHFLSGQGFADFSANNVIFFWTAPLITY